MLREGEGLFVLPGSRGEGWGWREEKAGRDGRMGQG